MAPAVIRIFCLSVMAVNAVIMHPSKGNDSRGSGASMLLGQDVLVTGLFPLHVQYRLWQS